VLTWQAKITTLEHKPQTIITAGLIVYWYSQDMSEVASEASGHPSLAPNADQPVSPAHSNSSQRALQLQQQQLLQQQQQQLLNQQQQQQLLQQQQFLQQQGQPGLLGQVPGMGGQFGQHLPPLQGNFMGQQPFASQGMAQQPFASQGMAGMPGMAGQLPVFSEAMAQGPSPGQGNGMPPNANAQQLKQNLIGQIPAGQPGSKQHMDSRASGGSVSSIPALPGFGMVGQLPDQGMNRPMVGQFSQQSMYQQPVSFGFQQQLLGQQLNLPLASAGMSMPQNNQFGFGQPFSLYPNALQRPGPMVAGSHVGSIDGSVYNMPDSASVMSRNSAVQPMPAPPVVSLASLSTQQKVDLTHMLKLPSTVWNVDM